ncbi:MAG: glycosyltransferase family 4 protein [Bacteroidetes bacterium]|nr:glycosyltransferase family 4 protein [Bacteroidota bacterium]
MKILVVGNRVPWPLHDGGAIATYGMLRSLAENGAEVDFFSFNTKKHFAENAIIEKYFAFCKVHLVSLDASVKPLNALWNLLFGSSYHLERYDDLEAAVELYDLIQSSNYDCVMVEGLYSMPITWRVMKQMSARPNNGGLDAYPINSNETIQKEPIKWVYRSHNLEYQIWERLAISTPQPLKKWYLALQSKRLKRAEIDAWCRMDAIVPIVETDSLVIRNSVSNNPKQIRLVDSGAENIAHELSNHPADVQPQIHVYQPGIAIERPFAFIHQPMSLFHIGSMEWQANEQGVIWFLNKVWPLVLSVQPNAKFHLAGKGLSKQDPRFFQSGIVNHGEVSNAEDFMHEHGVMIVPIQAGSGIRIKTLEAMALGVPVVSTSVGAQGLTVESGTQMIIADDPAGFADGIIQLLLNPAASQAMTQHARVYVEQHHNLKRNTAELLAFLQSL